MLSKSTLQFLQDLAANNNKSWFDKNRARYESAKREFVNFLDEVFIGVADFDTAISNNFDSSKRIFRINRDLRFSKDKSPYKINFGGAIAPDGMRTGMAAYYVHVEPGNNSGIGGGLHLPDAKMLYKVRCYIAEHADELLDLLSENKFHQAFGDLSMSEMSKRLPEEFTPDNPAFDYLRLKSFTVWKIVTDADLSKLTAETVIDSFKTVMPLMHFLNKALAS